MNRYLKLSIFLILAAAYFYDFVLCLWGKTVEYNRNVEYIIIFHILAIICYLFLTNGFLTDSSRNRAELFFVLHGCLISVFPYNGYLTAGIILMTGALIGSAIKNRAINMDEPNKIS